MKAKVKPQLYNTPTGPKYGFEINRPSRSFSTDKGGATLYQAAAALLKRPEGVTEDELRATNAGLGGSDTAEASYMHMVDATVNGMRVLKTGYQVTSYHLIID